MTEQKTTPNPILEVSPLAHLALPFDQIRNEHFLPALDGAIERARAKVEEIKSNSEPPTFENTLVALETATEDLDRVAGTFFNLLSAHTNDELQALAQEFSPRIAAFSSDVQMDPQLFARIEAVYKSQDQLKLSTEDARLLDKTYRGFVRNGSRLPDDKKERLKEIDQELSRLSPKFADNLLKATNDFKLWITDEKDLAGLPESLREDARAAAKEAGREDAWLFTLHAPSYIPFLTYADNRELRQKIWLAYNQRAYSGETSNQELCLKTVQLRHERAQLLGFRNHAEFVLAERMAETPERVKDFLERLLEVSKPAAERDMAELIAFKKERDGDTDFQAWDHAYYTEKLKEKLFTLDQEKLRPYFRLENVVQGVFEHAKRLYNLNFKKSDQYPVYHPDVTVYEVTDETDGSFVGLFYTDFFPRPSKRGGAWMTSFLGQGLYLGEVRRPQTSIVCNFTKPGPNRPSLLTFEEVQTLFHEFGHALHELLSQCTYRSIGGANVYWDFVELPSQIMENWVLEKDSLNIFAHHYETGEPLPADWIEKLKEMNRFQAGYRSLRQVQFALLDLAWHTTPPDQIRSVPEFETAQTARTRVLPHVPGTSFSVTFAHIFSGGYSAGYYSYKWAEVLDADAFELFKEKGLFNKDIARKFKENILTQGDKEHPLVLYKRFRGRDPDPDALLRRDGLLS